MRGTRMTLLVGLLLLPALLAADRPTLPGEQLEALKKEFEKSRREFNQANGKMKMGKERRELREAQIEHRHACARRALELARKHPNDPVAVDALSWIIDGGLGWGGADAEIEAAFDLLQTDYITSDKLRRVCEIAFVYDSVSIKPEQFLRAVLEKNPQRELRGHACYFLGRIVRSHAAEVKKWREIRDSPEANEWEASLNGEVIKRVKAGNPDKLNRESENLFERVILEYGEVKTHNERTLADTAKAMLFEMHNLLVGKVAPEIEGEDIDGKRFKLSDYRGKAVVLDFWGHW